MAPLPNDMLAVLILTGSGDAELTSEFLRGEGLEPVICDSPRTLITKADSPSVGALVIADERMSRTDFDVLAQAIDRQPPWSDLPVILFCGKRVGVRDAQRLMERFNVTLLERPVSRSTIVAAVRSALRARRRQFEARDLLSQIEEANHQLAEADRRKDDFLAVLGHELRNPLSAIRMATTAMQLARNPEAIAKHRLIIDRQSRTLSRLVDDLLDVSRITRGKIHLSIEPVDLCEVARRCAQAMEAESRARRHVLTVSTPPSAVIVDADPVRLEQVLSNLVANALKYTPDGGRVEIHVQRRDGMGELSVKDTGIGIAPDMIPALFSPFAQVDKSLSRSKGGLGLGLAVAKGIIELHHGTITGRSDGEGRGCEFTVSLPLSQRAVVKPSVAVLPVAPRRLKVAVVEDNADARETTSEFLTLLGHDVSTAADGASGLQLLSTVRPEVAVVDIGLPMVDGYEIARQVRADPLLCETRLVALTGYGQPEDRQRALESGFDVHLVKPVDLASLVRVMAELRPADSQGTSPSRQRGAHSFLTEN